MGTWLGIAIVDGIANVIKAPTGSAGGQRAKRAGGVGEVRKIGSRVGEDQLANLIIYPPQSLALWGGVIICRDDEHSADSHSV